MASVKPSRTIVMAYYSGTSFLELPQGRVPVGKLLALRVVDAERAKVVEEVYRVDEFGMAQRYLIRLCLEGGRIVFKEEQNLFSGEGKFGGLDGNWDFVILEAKLPDGTKVKIEDRFHSKKLWARKQVFLPDGKIVGTFIDEGQVITQEEYEEKKSKLKVAVRN